jgi:hypothetical protein
VVLVALASCGDLLYCVSKELKADVDVIKTALANDRRAFQYVDDELREDEVFVGEMMTQYGVYLQHAHGSLKNNQVLREIAKKNLYERLKATGELIDVYSEEWLSKQSDDAILNSSMAKEFDEKFGVEYRSSLQVAYLCGRDDSLEFSVVHSKLRKQIKDGTHFPDFLFFNNLTDQILCVGLGRKNRIFVLDSETNDVIDVFGVPSTPSSNKKYIFEFARLDHAGVVKTIVHALAEAASFMDEQAEIDDYESSEFEELSDQIYEAVSKIQAFFPQCEGGDLNTNDY